MSEKDYYDHRVTLMDSVVEKIAKNGPVRVVVNKDGAATSPEDAQQNYHVKPDVIYIREDGWSLGAPFELIDVAEKTWRGDWVAFMRRPRDGTGGWEWWPHDEPPECGGKVYKYKVVDKPRSYPECEKMRAVHEKSQAIGEFLDWLNERGIILASYYEEAGLSPHRVNVEALLAEYFGIDLDKAEQEKRTILEELRKQHDNPDDS